MPVNRKLMSKLKEQYGSKKGERIYYALESQGKIEPAQAKKSAHSRKGKRR